MMESRDTPQRIGRYDVIRKIATGGMAELFLGRFVGPGGFEKRCAIKRILPQFAADETFTRMFLTEARVTAMFDHPNLVQIFELGQDQKGQFFIAMELVNGINLRQLITMCNEQNTAVPPELAAYMMTQALDGLAYAHQFRDPDGRTLNLVHRDISPQNILVSYEGAVKLVDFGIVKGASISGETQAGMLKGKVAYMSPEQASGEPIDARSDLFSLGVCGYELIVGERPFRGANEIMTLKAILEDAPIHLTAFVPDCPIGIEQAIYKALEKYPQDRYDNARQFQAALQSVLRGSPATIGRHVLAEFLSSLTESETTSFIRSNFKIPRESAGFAYATGPNDSIVPPSKPYVPASTIAGAHPLASVPRAKPLTGPPQESTPTAMTMGGVSTSVRAAAGLDGRASPLIVLAFLCSMVAGALLVWSLTRTPSIVVEAAEPLAVREPPQQPAVPTKGPDVAVKKTPSMVAPPAEKKAATAVKTKKTSTRKTRTRKSRDPKRRRTLTAKKTREAPVAAKPGSTGSVAIESTPSGLDVYLAGKRLGKTPLEATLPAGTHLLKFKRTGFGIEASQTVRVSKGGIASASVVVARGTIDVVTRPFATVYVNSKKVGVTPLKKPIYEGRHTIRLVTEDGREVVLRETVEGHETKQIRHVFR